MSTLFREDKRIINVGLQSFADSIVSAGGKSVQVDWTPPAGGNRAAGWCLAQLLKHPRVEAANEKAYEAFLAAQPVLAGIGTARTQLPGMEDRMILHAGPPIAWREMCGPMQGAVIGAILYEGWAADPDAARRLAEGGSIALEPAHHHAAVGPMAGIISPSMPVWIVNNAAGGNRAYSNLNEGLGKVLRFGANSPEVIKRLRWIAEVLELPGCLVFGATEAEAELKAQALALRLHAGRGEDQALFKVHLSIPLLGVTAKRDVEHLHLLAVKLSHQLIVLAILRDLHQLLFQHHGVARRQGFVGIVLLAGPEILLLAAARDMRLVRPRQLDMERRRRARLAEVDLLQVHRLELRRIRVGDILGQHALTRRQPLHLVGHHAKDRKLAEVHAFHPLRREPNRHFLPEILPPIRVHLACHGP